MSRLVVMRQFVEEKLVAGDLVHMLACGHADEAWIDRDSAMPVDFRPCNPCAVEAAIDDATRRPS